IEGPAWDRTKVYLSAVLITRVRWLRAPAGRRYDLDRGGRAPALPVIRGIRKGVVSRAVRARCIREGAGLRIDDYSSVRRLGCQGVIEPVAFGVRDYELAVHWRVAARDHHQILRDRASFTSHTQKFTAASLLSYMPSFAL